MKPKTGKQSRMAKLHASLERKFSHGGFSLIIHSKNVYNTLVEKKAFIALSSSKTSVK